MTKFSVTKCGKPLSKRLYTWDEETRTFSSKEDGLVLDFTNIHRVTFRTGSDCTFKTGGECIFKTGSHCKFDTYSSVKFTDFEKCVFIMNWCGSFETGSDCIFKTGDNCTFNTGERCIFKTGDNCTFKTKDKCNFITYHNCSFDVGEQCVLTRRDIYDIIPLPTNKILKLNDYQIKGFTLLDKQDS